MMVLKNQKGFTIVEIMVAAVILVIAAVSLLALYSTNFGWIVNAGFVEEAINAAKSSLDNMISNGTADTTDKIVFTLDGSQAYIDATHPVEITGKVIEGSGTSDNGSETVSIKTFVPATAPTTP